MSRILNILIIVSLIACVLGKEKEKEKNKGKDEECGYICNFLIGIIMEILTTIYLETAEKMLQSKTLWPIGIVMFILIFICAGYGAYVRTKEYVKNPSKRTEYAKHDAALFAGVVFSKTLIKRKRR